MIPALTFEIGCLECEGQLELDSRLTSRPTQRSATFVCTTCEAMFTVQVTMAPTVMKRKLPMEPLMQWILARNDVAGDLTGDSPVAYIANRLDIPVSRVHRYRTDGIPDRVADDLATRLNIHPSEVWHDWLVAS